MVEPDWNDPCAVLEWLRPRYYRVAAGLQTVQIRFNNRATNFGQADISKLDALMARLREECAAKKGERRKRRARAYMSGKGY